MAARPPRRPLAAWRGELVRKLETIHNLAVEADAYQSAFRTVYGETSWSSNGGPERRRALNRMSCYADQVSRKLDELLRESQAAVEFALKRTS